MLFHISFEVCSLVESFSSWREAMAGYFLRRLAFERPKTDAQVVGTASRIAILCSRSKPFRNNLAHRFTDCILCVVFCHRTR